MGWLPVELDTEVGLGIYARQSTFAQVKNSRQSTEMQTDDLVDFAKRLGWNESNIITFTQDLAKSGKLRIDQREGLRSLIHHIEKGEIKTVLVFLEDRLFRDETGIQYNMFIDVCKRNGVIVITPHMTYDFSNPFHVKQFRWKCEEAADFLRDYVIHRLHGAKNRISESGRYAGRSIPVGFLVDRQEFIVVNDKAVPNPTYRKFIVYEPHATVVRWLFRRFWELKGRLRTLCRELQHLPFVFPEFDTDVDVAQCLSQYRLKKVPGGYHISRPGLKGLLTNVAYIGYWIHLGEIVSKDNHDAIVEKDLFWYAFHRLSPYLITGERNEEKKGYIRYSRKDPLPALLKNVIGSHQGGRVYTSTSGLTHKPLYIIEEKDQQLVLKYHAATPCKDIDDVFSARLLERMKHTKRFEHYRDYATRLAQERKEKRDSIIKQLAEIEKKMDGILATLSLPPEKLKKSLREKCVAQYSALEENKNELEAQLTSMDTDQESQKLMDYYSLVHRLSRGWERIPFVERQSLAEVIVKGVYLDEMTAHWLRFEVQWIDPQWGTEYTYLYRKGGGHKTWTESENALIRDLFPSAPRENILAKMPRRSWSAIMQQARKLNIRRKRNLVSTCGIPEYMSMEDIAFMKEAGIVLGERSCHTWESVRRQVGGVLSALD